MTPLTNSREFKNIISAVEREKYPIGVFGLAESSRSYLINGIFEKMDKPLLVVTHNDIEARNLYEDLSFYTPKVFYFPAREVVFYNIDAISGDLRWERLKVIREMLRRGNRIIVTSIDSLAAKFPPLNTFLEYMFTFKVGDVLNLEDMTRKLIECGYERVDMVENKGQFSVKGGILDIFPPEYMYPYRLELFGDEIDSIRSFNLQTQRSIEKASSIEIFPAKEIILKEEDKLRGSEAIEKDLASILASLKSKKNKEAGDKIKELTNANLISLKENWSFETIDSFLPYFYEKTSTLFDYIGEAFFVMDDTQRCKGKIDSLYFEFEEDYKSFLQRGSILPSQGKLLMPKEELFEEISSRSLITLNAIPKSVNIFAPKAIISFTQITLHHYHGQLDLLIEDIVEKKAAGYKTVILSGTRARGERLVATLRDRGIESVYQDKVEDLANSQVVITFGNQLKGFEFPELKLCIISDKEVFGESKRKIVKKQKKGAGKLKSFTELKLGDYVVHANHGIGLYRGVKQLELEGIKKDYLEISYDSGDKLYVPVEQLDLVQKYIGTEGKAPKVNKLGGSEWAKTKAKVKKSITDIAEDLIKLYALRSTLKGHSFSRDTVWQKQFEEEFPYEETQDQLTSIEEIKSDMESDKAMDRLLCGDVGYGKTEVAMRAMFKAAMDGKQSAFLVPTTILAEQHYNNFVQRFSDFPIKIDMISRFRTPAQQKDTIKALKEGNVDVLIGTHRILQKDIQFKDLGLLIIDEEQRFGVTHKEKIKNLKKNIDVLTLSATPIPRTLHMSLVGVRDISVIETPPEDRYPVQTYVVEYNEQLMRDAIMREINRGGQIYFVYNRVETILDMERAIQKLVPEARIAIAHGQMSERELENVVVDFMKQEYDVLLCTTIIETGMDIQNVNTIIIYDADKMGLSQLYQLRGRVGRSNRIAYAYLTYKKDKVLTEIAEKRLLAIKEFTELGSGFKIAMRDLEIRGAGNMMGAAQHGHMAAVGYDLYCRMLEDTIRLIKGEIDKEPIETTVELKIDAYIPMEYIEDEIQKIEVYKKIAAISSREDYLDVQEELEDRFSDIPQSVVNLMDIAYLRSIARELGISEIKEKEGELLFIYENMDRIKDNLLQQLLMDKNPRFSFKTALQPVLSYKLKKTQGEDKLNILKENLEYMRKLMEK